MILDKIVARKKEEVNSLKTNGLVKPETEIDPPRGFTKNLTDYIGVAVIAEAKKASPSKGIIRADFDPARIARAYKSGGAQAISVLTDEDFFQGSLTYIPVVRKAVDLPVLRKDFIIDPIQIEQASIYGADAILLIAAILAQSQLADYQALALEKHMDVLVEVHDEQELEKALSAGSRLIGINNRNLKDFSMDMNTTFRLMREIPPDIPVVSESGIVDANDMQRLAANKVCAALIGETLMRADDPALALIKLRQNG